MLICGIKVSHDAGVALIDGNQLVFSVEVEKLDNNHRYHGLGCLERVADILRRENVDPADVDRFVVDGWWSQSRDGSICVRSQAGGRRVELAVAPYVDAGPVRPCLERYSFRTEHFGFAKIEYSSYHHATGHLIGCYCSSPFAKRGEDALILVWDGGMVPRLYQITAETLSARPVGSLLPLIGNIFGDFCGCFEPFTVTRTDSWTEEQDLYHRLSIAGKAMAYAALGHAEENAFPYLDEITDSLPGISADNARVMAQRVSKDRAARFRGMSNADIICTLQEYLGRRLLKSISDVVRRHFPHEQPNLGIAGGCALNIKWNRMMRDSGLFREIWVPPFPNDSGAALGAASAEMFCQGKIPAFDWDVYRGPLVDTTVPPAGWASRPCSERDVAAILHTEGEPVVVLSGRAELGPRALGNRSILAPATDPDMKDRLNQMKGRENYRPVAPICLESNAHEIFDPGTPDPYMLFEHQVRGDWAQRIPAVIHLDGTARLQTIEPDGCRAARILSEYEQLSGIPVLCNTSANFNGSGFFPDLTSAAKWGKTKYIWADGTLYLNPLMS